jgi:peptidoglycan/xylan/chitin deacetylase (PgdA/CDA1 family)
MSALATSWASGPLCNRSGDAVFLCYHSIADDGPPFVSVPVERFERQLALLERRGYRAGSRRELAGLARGRRPQRPLAFLTFDDGFADNACVVAPLLRRRGWTAQVFVLPPAVDAGRALDWPETRARRAAHPRVMRSLDWHAAEAMADAGFDFGSHTNNHGHLPRLGDEELRQELLDSRRRIAERLGRCDMLAYPFGEWDARVVAAAAAAGYRLAFTLPFGSQRRAGPLTIPRIAVDHRDDERRFALKLSPLGRTVLLSPAKARLRKVRSLADRGGFSRRGPEADLGSRRNHKLAGRAGSGETRDPAAERPGA